MIKKLLKFLIILYTYGFICLDYELQKKLHFFAYSQNLIFENQ